MLERSRGSHFGVNDEDWQVATDGRVNVLLVGAEPLTTQVVDAMSPSFRRPIARWVPEGGNAESRPCETLLVQAAHRLTLEQQHALDGWLADGSQPQVVTVAAEPLFPLVEQGKFLASLYYRLNVVYLDLAATGLPQVSK